MRQVIVFVLLILAYYILCTAAPGFGATAYSYDNSYLYSEGYRLRDATGRTIFTNASSDYSNPVWVEDYAYKQYVEDQIEDEVQRRLNERD